MAINVRTMETWRVPALDGTRRLEDHWKLEDDDIGVLEQLGTDFVPRPTPEQDLLVLQVESDEEDSIPWERVLSKVEEHLGVERIARLSEDQVLHLLEHRQGMFPRIFATNAIMDRGGTDIRGCILWLMDHEEGTEEFAFWLFELGGLCLDSEDERRMWLIVPKPE